MHACAAFLPTFTAAKNDVSAAHNLYVLPVNYIACVQFKVSQYLPITYPVFFPV